jgi:hypothetical protein
VGRASFYLGTSTVALLVGYGTVASMTQGNPWYLIVLLWLTIIVGISFLITGIWYLVDLIVWKIRPLLIEIDNSIGRTNVTKTDLDYRFKITYSLETRSYPIQIISPKLCFRSEALESTEDSFKLDKKKDVFTSDFILSDTSPLFGNLLQNEKYRLTFVVKRKKYTSEEFALTKADVLLLAVSAVSTAKVGIPTVTVGNPPIKDNASTERIFTDASAKYLTSFYVGQSKAQGGRSVKEYIGKWMKINGVISSTTSYRGVTRIIVTDDIGTEICMIFRTELIPGIELSEKKTVINAVGRIQRIDMVRVTLDDCELAEDS